jgi:hypothetical protein
MAKAANGGENGENSGGISNGKLNVMAAYVGGSNKKHRHGEDEMAAAASAKTGESETAWRHETGNIEAKPGDGGGGAALSWRMSA